jgi:addiction module RelE/StbE family toxin
VSQGKKVKFRPLADKDLDDIFEYISNDNLEAATNLLDELHNKISALPSHPKIYKLGRLPGTREMIVRQNYVVVYRESLKGVVIVRVLHTSRMWP